jgi:hypothetical protein
MAPGGAADELPDVLLGHYLLVLQKRFPEQHFSGMPIAALLDCKFP